VSPPWGRELKSRLFLPAGRQEEGKAVFLADKQDDEIKK